MRVLDLKKEAELALACDLSVIQDSFRFRALWRTQKIAAFLLDERGDVKREALAELIGLFENEGHIFFPTGTSDCVLRDHILRTLKAFRDNPNLLRFLKRFQRPLCHKWAERIIGDAVGQFNAGEVTDRMIRCAVLSACLVYLRQSVGSCFATAPAILIQEEQIENLLQDLYDLLTTGVLKRTFGGVEYAVPLSPSTGIGDLRKPLGAQSWFSPGLLTALRCTREELKALLERSSASNAEELIHLVLMQRFGLNEDDLRSFKGSQKFFAKSAEPLSRKSDQCQKMVDKEREAKAAFKAVVDHPLLKAWEFTIASLTEAKMEFSKWNLYASLGLHHEEEGGIGSVIYHYLSSKLDHNNQKVEDYQRDYEIAYDQLRATEILLKQASTESDIRRLKAEFQTRLSHMQSCLEIRDRAYSAASHYSTLFSFLQEQYSAKCPEYFQEIYDAEMQDVKTGPYEDSPAGFRLVYKHGRTDPSLWTMIYTSDQYIEALVSFFIATEHAIVQACEWEKGKRRLPFSLPILSTIFGPMSFCTRRS